MEKESNSTPTKWLVIKCTKIKQAFSVNFLLIYLETFVVRKTHIDMSKHSGQAGHGGTICNRNT
jgi:hypothetical protein